jgi:hypothetical protein
MDAGQERQADATRPSASWKAPFANGAIIAVMATGFFWGSFREFRPPAATPEPVSVDTLTKQADEVMRRVREFNELSRERSQITDAIKRRIEELQARQVAGLERAARDEEVSRLQDTLLAELRTTNRLLGAKHAEWEERERLAAAPRREQVARAAWEWQRGRRRLLAMAVAAAALAGWLFRQAYLRHREQVVAERAAGADRRRSARRRRRQESDPQWNQKLFFYPIQLAICISCLLFGLLGPEPRGGEKDSRESLVLLGLFGLAMSTIWLFFGSIDWSDSNTIKDRATGRRSAGDGEHSPDDGR